MKLFFVLCCFLTSSLALAEEILVFETPTPYVLNRTETTFEVNREKGRAWLNVKIWDSQMARRDRIFAEYEKKVDGLSFDTTTSKIVLERQGRQVLECATIAKRGRIFSYESVRLTNCSFKVKKVMRESDDGFRTYKFEATQVYIVTKD